MIGNVAKYAGVRRFGEWRLLRDDLCFVCLAHEYADENGIPDPGRNEIERFAEWLEREFAVCEGLPKKEEER